MPNVLLVGEDEQLLQIRAALLRTIGAKTACCTGSSAMALQECQHCELVVLCHSLSDERRSALAENVRIRWPETHVLLVTPTKALEQSILDAGVIAISSMDPYALIRHAEELLGQRKPRIDRDGNPPKGATVIPE